MRRRREVGLTNVLLSVRPKHAEAIVQGRKKYELRRTIFRREDVGQVYVYSTSPVSKIVGSFEVGDIIEDSPDGLWETCRRHAAVSQDEFFRYFAGAVTAFAIKIANMQRFASPLDPSAIFDDFKPPQSFRYLPMDINLHRENGTRGRAVQRREDSGRKKARKS
jgi:type I restriction enzyme S subunit